MSDRTDIDIKALRLKLKEKREELIRLSKISEESREAVELDQTRQGRLSRQDALMQQEMAKETERRRQAEISRIDRALEHIKTQDYGYCVSCDEPIAVKRLVLDPAITTCISCAK